MDKKYLYMFVVLAVLVFFIGFALAKVTGNAAKICGNGVCEAGENSAKCPADCSGGGGEDPVSYECSDKQDNDGDGLCDFEGCNIGRGKDKVQLGPDPDCVSAEDNTESPECIPSLEVCDGVDNDCDGSVDEFLTQACGVSNVGVCEFGVSTCTNGLWSVCVGNIDPKNETCEGSLDEDCDGNVDEGCSCTNGQTQSCGSSVGECQNGLQTCFGGQWGACVNETGPSIEICDGLDNDCNGQVDEGVCYSCDDSDGGLDYGVKGTVSGLFNNEEYTVEDVCNQGLLSEYYCEENQQAVNYFACNWSGNFTGCANGACH